MASLALPSALEAQLLEAARLHSTRQNLTQQEEVVWDLNLKSAAERLAPYKYDFNDGTGAKMVIEQRIQKRKEPGSPESGTGYVSVGFQ